MAQKTTESAHFSLVYGSAEDEVSTSDLQSYLWDCIVAQKTTESAHFSLVHVGTEDEVSTRLALLHGNNENDAGCCCMEVLMMLHACTLHASIEDKMGRRGACMGACMLAEYERVVMSLHDSERDEEIM